MPRQLLLALFFVLPAAWIVVAWLLVRDRVAFDTNKIALGDLVNVTSLAVAIVSMAVAFAAYRDMKQSGDEQLKTLGASRQSLETVAHNTLEQQKLLDTAVKTLASQLSLIQEQTNRELERLGRKPKLVIFLGEISAAELTKEPIVLAFDKSWQRFGFVVKNEGTAPVIKPTVMISAKPATVFVDAEDFRMAERANHHMYQFSGNTVSDILPYSQSKSSYRFPVDVTVPESVSEFELTMRIFGENVEAQEITARIKVVRVAAGPKP